MSTTSFTTVSSGELSILRQRSPSPRGAPIQQVTLAHSPASCTSGQGDRTHRPGALPSAMRWAQPPSHWKPSLRDRAEAGKSSLRLPASQQSQHPESKQPEAEAAHSHPVPRTAHMSTGTSIRRAPGNNQAEGLAFLKPPRACLWDTLLSRIP